MSLKRKGYKVDDRTKKAAVQHPHCSVRGASTMGREVGGGIGRVAAFWGHHGGVAGSGHANYGVVSWCCWGGVVRATVPGGSSVEG